MLKNLNTALRTVSLVGLVGIGGWWTLFLRGELTGQQRELEESRTQLVSLQGDIAVRDEQILELDAGIVERDDKIDVLDADLQTAELEIRQLEVVVQLLKVDHRIARIEVLEQTEDAADGQGIRTKIRFVDLGPDGEELGAGREFWLDGKFIYLESQVIKFDDAMVEGRDYLRGTSVCIFKRMFGDRQKPSDGVAIDSQRPVPWDKSGEDGIDPFHAELWKEFWDLANDPERAAEMGVRAIHGEAPFVEARPGRTYRVELRSSGGLSIKAE